MSCSVLFGITGNLIVCCEELNFITLRYTLYYDDNQTIWDSSEFNKTKLKPAREFINECEPFEYGGMHYNKHAQYDDEKLSGAALILYMFNTNCIAYKGNYKTDLNFYWLKDNTVCRLALGYKSGIVVRHPGPLVSEIKDKITWRYKISCRVSVSMGGLLLNSLYECDELLYVEGKFDGFNQIKFTSGTPCELPELTLILNIELQRFDDLILVKPGLETKSIFTISNSNIPDKCQFICRPNTSTVYIVDTETGEEQICNFIKHVSFESMLTSFGFVPSDDYKPGVKTYLRRGLSISFDVFCRYTYEYQRSPGMGKFTKAALH